MGTTNTTRRVAENVRVLLATRRITAQELAQASGVTRSTMSRRLAGTTPWPIDDLERVADYLGVSVQSLLAARDVA